MTDTRLRDPMAIRPDTFASVRDAARAIAPSMRGGLRESGPERAFGGSSSFRGARAGSGGETPIVPKGSISGRALVAVVAIMTYLAALTTGGVMLVFGAAASWESDVAREMTIQVRPVSGRDTEVEVARAVAIAKGAPGVADVRPYTKDESTKLLEPWLGAGLSLEGLPVPRLIVLRISPGVAVDTGALRQALAAQVAGASLDDHRGWAERMRAMAGTAIAVGVAALALMLAATVMSVTFATRGAMEANRPIVEVLHFIGAHEWYIVRQFQGHFLMLGLQGGGIGGGGAIATFWLMRHAGDWFVGTAGGEQAAALFGSFSIGFTGWLAILGQIGFIAAVTALTSRHVVYQTLRSIG